MRAAVLNRSARFPSWKRSIPVVSGQSAVFVGGANTPARARVFVDFLAERLRSAATK
jgi:hypothetical protein